MTLTLEISSKNYDSDSLNIMKAMSHLQTLCERQDSYIFSEPTSRLGWTFFKLSLKNDLSNAIEEKFTDMLSKYNGKRTEKFTKFMIDFFASRGSDVKLKLIEF